MKLSIKEETTREKIVRVQNDIQHYNRAIADIDKKLIQLSNKKASLKVKISKSTKHKSLLLGDLSNENRKPEYCNKHKWQDCECVGLCKRGLSID